MPDNPARCRNCGEIRFWLSRVFLVTGVQAPAATAQAPAATAAKAPAPKKPTVRVKREEKKKETQAGCPHEFHTPLFGRSFRLSRSPVPGLKEEQDDYLRGRLIDTNTTYYMTWSSYTEAGRVGPHPRATSDVRLQGGRIRLRFREPITTHLV